MKSEDLLKAIGEIDEQFIEEASPHIKTSDENLSIVSEETKENNTIRISEAKPKNMFRIIAPIAACACLVTAVSFVMVGLSKAQSGTSMPSAASVGKAEVQEKDGDFSEAFDGESSGYFDNSGNPLFSDESSDSPSDEKMGSETSTAPQISGSAEGSEAVSSSTESNDSENSAPDTYIDEIIIESIKISSSDVKAIKADMTYKEIIRQLGESANFGHLGMRQYIVDDNYVLSLRFNKLTDVCTKSGTELLADMVPYKVPERLSDKVKDNPIYGIVTDNKFISCVNNNPSVCYELNLSDAEIKFENGEPATADDIKLMSGLLVSFDIVMDSYPGIMHCTSVTILDRNS